MSAYAHDRLNKRFEYFSRIRSPNLERKKQEFDVNSLRLRFRSSLLNHQRRIKHVHKRGKNSLEITIQANNWIDQLESFETSNLRAVLKNLINVTSHHNEAFIANLLQSSLTHKLCKILTSKEQSHLQFTVLWCFTNIAGQDNDNFSHQLFLSGCFPIIIQYTKSPILSMQNQAFWMFANVAGGEENSEERNILVCKEGILESVLYALKNCMACLMDEILLINAEREANKLSPSNAENSNEFEGINALFFKCSVAEWGSAAEKSFYIDGSTIKEEKNKEEIFAKRPINSMRNNLSLLKMILWLVRNLLLDHHFNPVHTSSCSSKARILTEKPSSSLVSSDSQEFTQLEAHSDEYSLFFSKFAMLVPHLTALLSLPFFIPELAKLEAKRKERCIQKADVTIQSISDNDLMAENELKSEKEIKQDKNECDDYDEVGIDEGEVGIDEDESLSDANEFSNNLFKKAQKNDSWVFELDDEEAKIEGVGTIERKVYKILLYVLDAINALCHSSHLVLNAFVARPSFFPIFLFVMQHTACEEAYYQMLLTLGIIALKEEPAYADLLCRMNAPTILFRTLSFDGFSTLKQAALWSLINIATESVKRSPTSIASSPANELNDINSKRFADRLLIQPFSLQLLCKLLIDGSRHSSHKKHSSNRSCSGRGSKHRNHRHHSHSHSSISSEENEEKEKEKEKGNDEKEEEKEKETQPEESQFAEKVPFSLLQQCVHLLLLLADCEAKLRILFVQHDVASAVCYFLLRDWKERQKRHKHLKRSLAEHTVPLFGCFEDENDSMTKYDDFGIKMEGKMEHRRRKTRRNEWNFGKEDGLDDEMEGGEGGGEEEEIFVEKYNTSNSLEGSKSERVQFDRRFGSAEREMQLDWSEGIESVEEAMLILLFELRVGRRTQTAPLIDDYSKLLTAFPLSSEFEWTEISSNAPLSASSLDPPFRLEDTLIDSFPLCDAENPVLKKLEATRCDEFLSLYWREAGWAENGGKCRIVMEIVMKKYVIPYMRMREKQAERRLLAYEEEIDENKDEEEDGIGERNKDELSESVGMEEDKEVSTSVVFEDDQDESDYFAQERVASDLCGDVLSAMQHMECDV
ncbi:uncharacterized protein MONOS_5882 [Monocercomonoides exilis]|uniref:uncharacterized protein n=1 Tax=Monocercomonoides exilis TaxID=2049356 RepID=UPI00355A7B19|nr:hypothetical protein MONOS_5882 [Monocercomonoides exilis]|eukprot:MONOS_5882.1-p1 / transcript=MONOS_5882.1 / gene=MONOS_5882 / organism=Monocercomonoides_exilis_PA203 / gene_product=unspecified product / transcript_product=unspecified product / location=Mono_scaffold00177:46065-50017(+) / protein_length=1093 / sequence_SO=supercontig / SO=protein_coding / is_pseudo=false